VAIEDGGVAVANLTGVVEDNDLSSEVVGLTGRIVLGVTSDVSTADFLDGDVLDVEANVVTGDGLGERLVVHLNGLTSVVTFTGAKVTTIPGLRTPVSTRPTGTVPIPPIL